MPEVPFHDRLEELYPSLAKTGAILLSDQIEFYSRRTNLDPPLITGPEGEPLDTGGLKAARYNLRLGGSAHREGDTIRIDNDHPLVLGPHEVAVVQTYEQINLPRFLAARWNLRIDMVYKGLLWVGGMQVDPGWQGPLPCPIYNLSDRSVEIAFKERFAGMDFVRTTKYIRDGTGPEGYAYNSEAYEFKPLSDLSVATADSNRIRSAVSGLHHVVDQTNATVRFAVTLFSTALAILFAALAFFVVRQPAVKPGASDNSDAGITIGIIATMAALVAIVLSAAAIARSPQTTAVSKRYNWFHTLVLIAGASSIAAGISGLTGILAEAWPDSWVESMPSGYGWFLVAIGGILLLVFSTDAWPPFRNFLERWSPWSEK